MPQPIIALTRPKTASLAMADALGDLPAQILVAPLQEIRPGAQEISLGARDILVVTSSAAIRALADAGKLAGRDMFVVGTRSAELARRAGGNVLAHAATGQALAQEIIAIGPDRPCHYLRGRHISFDMQKQLISAGIETVSTEVYAQVELPASQALLDALEGDCPVVLPLFSARSAKILARLIAKMRPSAPLHAVSISVGVDAKLQDAAMTQRFVAASPDADAMMAEIRALVARLD